MNLHFFLKLQRSHCGGKREIKLAPALGFEPSVKNARIASKSILETSQCIVKCKKRMKAPFEHVGGESLPDGAPTAKGGAQDLELLINSWNSLSSETKRLILILAKEGGRHV